MSTNANQDGHAPNFAKPADGPTSYAVCCGLVTVCDTLPYR